MLHTTRALVREFADMLCHRRGERLEAWASDVPSLLDKTEDTPWLQATTEAATHCAPTASHRRLDPERETRRPIAKLEALGP